MTALRFADDNPAVIEGVLVPFDGPFPGGKDAYQTRFGPDTEYCLDWFSERPLLYTHAVRGGPGTTPVGRITDLAVRADVGVWMKAELDMQSEYFDALKEMIEGDKLFLSSGSVEHLVEIEARSGKVRQWPIVEGSLTTTPANTYATVAARAVSASFEEAGIDVPADTAEKLGAEAEVVTLEGFRAKLDSAAKKALPDSDFAYIDSKGERSLPINDASHVKNAMARFDQQEFESDEAKGKAWKKIMTRAKKLGVKVADTKMSGRTAPWSPVRAKVAAESVPYERSYEDIRSDIENLINPHGPFDYVESYSNYAYVVATYDSFVIICRYEDGDSTYWQVAYTLGEDDEPQLGEATEVEQVYVPVATSITPLTSDARSLSQRAVALAQRTKDLSKRRADEGRPFSPANRAAITEAVNKLAEAREELVTVVARVDESAAEAARAALWSSPDARKAALELFELEMALL